MKNHLNLLPASYCRKQLTLRRARQWCCIWMVTGIALAAVGWGEWSQLRASRLRLDSLQRSSVPVTTARQENERLEQEIQRLRQRETLALALSDEQPLAILVGRLSLAAQACHGQIAIENLQMDRLPAISGTLPNTCRMILDGIAINHQAVVRFNDELKNSGIFTRLELKQTGVAERGTQTATTFRIECAF